MLAFTALINLSLEIMISSNLNSRILLFGLDDVSLNS